MIERKVRFKSLQGGFRSALVSGVISAAVSAYATLLAYPAEPVIASLGLGALSGFVIGTLIPLGLFVTGIFLINAQAFRRLPYYAFMGLTAAMIMFFTIAVYFVVGLVLFRDRITDTSQLILAFGLSAFLSVVLSVANAVRQFAGPGVFMAIISGKYHRAYETSCAFVFIDLVSSTAMAERLGSERFFRMINDFHAIVEACCTYYDGVLYKYLGDGAILVWHTADCAKALACVAEVRTEIQQQKGALRDRYGEDVSFTAGLHAGAVITGEIGDNRKEIGYWGDAVNTAARIQSACKELNRDVLCSEDFFSRLPVDAKSTLTSAGLVSLRGKERPLELFCARELA